MNVRAAIQIFAGLWQDLVEWCRHAWDVPFVFALGRNVDGGDAEVVARRRAEAYARTVTPESNTASRMCRPS